MHQLTIARITTGLFCLLCVVGVCPNVYKTVSMHKKIVDCKGSEACFSRIMLDTVAKNDLNDGFKFLESVYADTPSFRPDCHNFTLRVTQVLYLRHPDYLSLPVAPDIVTCNYGFLQQYPASILLATHNIAAAQTFCKRVARSIGGAVPGAEAECYRGIGRGLPFVDASSQGDPVRMAAFALHACKELTSDPNDYGTCLSGLFNVIGRTEVARQSGLSVEASDPMRLCKIQIDQEARDRCFGNFKATVISMVDVNDTASAEHSILRLYGEGDSATTNDAIWTIGYEWGRSKLVAGAPFGPAIAACAALSPASMHACFQGISVGLAKHGVPGAQHILMISFCKAARAAIPALIASDCPSVQAVGYIRGFYSPKAFGAAYASMKQELGSVAVPDTTSYGF